MRTKPAALLTPVGLLVGHYTVALMSPLQTTMIKKFFDSNNFSAFERNVEAMAIPFVAIVIGIGSGLISTVAASKVINNHVLSTCDQKLNQIIYIRTILGDTYGCVSKAVLYGPPAPIKP